MTMEELSNVHGRAWDDVDVSNLPRQACVVKWPRVMAIVITVLTDVQH